MSTPQYVLAIDNGTTSTRAIIFDHAGAKIGTGQLETTQIFPQSGWVEHDPVEIWNNTRKVIELALEQASLTASDIAAIGITNQRETAVAWSRSTGKTLCKAIVWQCRRTAEFCNQLAVTHGSLITAKTGLIVDAYFSASKLRWSANCPAPAWAWPARAMC